MMRTLSHEQLQSPRNSHIYLTNTGNTFTAVSFDRISHFLILCPVSIAAALALMHVLSAVMGFALPSLLPKLYTHYASTVRDFISILIISFI